MEEPSETKKEYDEKSISSLFPSSHPSLTVHPDKENASHYTAFSQIPKYSDRKMSLTTKNERLEMEEILNKHPRLQSILVNPDNLLHALKVIASIRPNTRLSTVSGIYLQTSDDPWMGIRRRFWGEDRLQNIRVVKSIFIAAFVMIDDAFDEREQFIREPTSSKRQDIIQSLKNKQLIERITLCIQQARGSIDHLKSTYSEDANMCALVDMLNETIKDRIQLIQRSIEILDGKCKDGLLQ